MYKDINTFKLQQCDWEISSTAEVIYVSRYSVVSPRARFTCNYTVSNDRMNVKINIFANYSAI